MRTRFACATAFLLSFAFAAAALADVTLVGVTGDVEIGRGSPPIWRAAHAGDAVRAGEMIRTGAASRAELGLGDQRSARLYERSLLRIGAAASGGGVRSVELDAGASLFDLVRRATGLDFDVRTPEIIVSVKGTRFLVSATSGPDYASVFRGEVVLAGEGFDPTSIHPGFTGARGEVQPTPFGDPWESWVESAIAPAVAIELEGAGEIHDAVEAARESRQGESVRDLPAKLDDGEGKSGESDDDSLDPAPDPAPDLESGDGRLDDSGRGGVELDPVEDVLEIQAETSGTGSTLLDAVLNADAGDFAGGGSASGNSGPGGGFSGGPGGTTTQFPFTFDVLTSGGPNTVTVGFGAESVTLDGNAVDDAANGDRLPYGSFNSVLDSLNVDPIALATYLDSLI